MKVNTQNTKKLYHITHIDNFTSIINEGLKANNKGEIFIFDNIDCASHIAINQIFLFDNYALFEINPKGIDVELINDNVTEYTSKHQFIIYQNIILPKYLKFKNFHFVDIEKHKKWYNKNILKM
jgi:hypothetical protein